MFDARERAERYENRRLTVSDDTAFSNVYGPNKCTDSDLKKLHKEKPSFVYFTPISKPQESGTKALPQSEQMRWRW